ncbi:hypothetical protein HDU87_006187 [Geranomyces variabilis]|uniref:Uncharacterized protein n=1 Tax=Geranomyces variabilis TaxID=109894 RepID=A0AAD5TIE8_9FUNG|nr:hypothetical protein HDU87_006187 [Geranomyces variabilis]
MSTAPWNVGANAPRNGPGSTPLAYQPAQVNIVTGGDGFAPNPIKPYQAQNELDRLRMGTELIPTPASGGAIQSGNAAISSSASQGLVVPSDRGGFNPAAREYSTTSDASEIAQNAYAQLQNAGSIGDGAGSGPGGYNSQQQQQQQGSILSSRHAQPYNASTSVQATEGGSSRGKSGESHRAGTTYTQVNGDPQTHTVTLSTTTYQPSGSNLVEAVDTYTYRRPETTNGEYGNFPRRGHSEHVVESGNGSGGASNLFANGGKVVKNGDKIVPLGGPGSAEERPGLARHGGITA